jgi:thiol-disulfide isomerase/thioredoxin
MHRILPIAVLVLQMLLPLSAQAAGSALSSDPLFGATLTDLADRPAALAGFRGRPLVINFWARWCPPCIDEIPDLIGARARFKARGLEVIGLAVEDSTIPVREFASAHHMDYPVLLTKDKGFALMQALGNTAAGLPYTLVLDRHGNVVARKMGRMSKSEMDTAFAAALN